MRKGWIFLLPLFLSVPLFTEEQQPAPQEPQQQEPLVPPQEIERQLSAAEKEFAEAKKMFNPWYTGPLLTPSAHVLPPPNVLIQPYLFYINNYARFDKHGKSHDIPHLQVVKPTLAPSSGRYHKLDGHLPIHFWNLQ